MPEKPPTLQQVLLRKATSIGPNRGRNLPMIKPENQQPDPFLAILSLLGDPLTNSVPGASTAMSGLLRIGQSLPMDEASRAARAAEMGYNMDVFHGARDRWPNPHWVNGDIREFDYHKVPYGDAGIHVTPSTEVAENAIREGSSLSPSMPFAHKANILPLKARIQNPLQVEDMGIWADPTYWLKNLENPAVREAIPQQKAVLDDLYEQARQYGRNSWNYPAAELDKVKQQWGQTLKNTLKRHGYDSIAYPNKTEGKGELSYMLLDPNQLRSRWATFDPSRAKSGDLLASILAGLGLGAGAAGSKAEPPQ